MSNERFEELAAKSMGLEVAETTTENTEVSKETTNTESVNTKLDSKVDKIISAVEKQVESELQQESSLKEDSTQETGEGTENSEKSFESLLAEKTNGKYKTYEEIESLLSTKETNKSFANEQMEKLNDYVSKGGDVQEYLNTQTANYDEMDELALVKSHLKFNNHDLKNDEVDLLFNSQYKLDEDTYTPDEVKLSKIKLRNDAKKAKKELLDFQKDSAIPKQHRQQVNERKNAEENQKLWDEKIDKSLTDFNEVSFDVNDKGEKFAYSLSEDAIENVRTSNKNLASFWNRYVNEDGSENITKLNKDMATLNNLDSIIRSAFAQGLSKGKGDIIDDIKNPSYSPDTKSSPDKPLSIQEQIAAELRKNN
jgi:hypothetical protein